MWHFPLVIILVITAFVTQAQQHLYPVHIDKKWGMMDVKGNLVVEPYYQAIGVFQEGLYAIAEKEGLLGVLDTTGTLVIPCQYTLMDYVGRGLFSVKTETTNWKIINTEEHLILDDMAASIEFLEDPFLSYEEITGLGLADLKKGVLLPPEFSEFEFLNNAFIIASNREGRKFIYDYDGNKILASNYEKIEIKNNLIWAKRSGKWGAFTFKGVNVIPHEWLDYEAVGSNFYHFKNEEEKSVLYSVELNTVILKNIKRVEAFNDRYIEVLMPSGTRSIIDLAGQIVFSGKYDFVTKFGENAFRVKKGDFQGVVNDKGVVIVPLIYDYISNLNSSVAIARKGKKHGIVNLNGEVVIPIAFPPSLELNDNNARYKDTSGNLQLFVFDENGQMANNTKFSNMKSLKVRSSGQRRTGRRQAAPITGVPTFDPFQISDSLRWKFHGGARKWGLWHIQEKRYKFTPQWANVQVLREQGISIVRKQKQNIGGRLNTGRIRLKVHEVYGVFTNVHGLPVTAMEFLDIRITDFTTRNLSVARCVFVGGSQGVIESNGRVLTRGYAYIGEFVEGKARATKKGQLLVDLEGKKKRPIGRAAAHFNSFMATCHFDNDDDPKYYKMFEEKGVLYCDNAKWGYLDTFGVVHSALKYDYVENYSNDRALIRKDGKWGMLDEEGNEVLKPAYDNFNFLPNSKRKLFFIAQNRVLHGAIDSNANVIVPVKYLKVRAYHEDRIAVKNIAGRWGFVNRTGQEVVKAQYRVAHDFSEGLAVIFDKSRWGAINPSGGIVIKPQYLRMGDFTEGKAWVHLRKGKKGYIDKNGTLLFSKRFSRLTNFKNGIARVYVRKKGWGLINTKGEYILKPKKAYDNIEAFNEYGLAKVKIGKKYRLMNEAGELIGKKAYGKIRDFKEGFAAVRIQALTGNHIGKTNLNWMFIDTTGEVVIDKEFRQLKDFSEGRAAFTSQESKRGYINTKGEVIIEATYFRAEPFEDNRALVWDSYNRTGVIDTTGKVIIPVKYNRILDIEKGLALVRRNSWTYYFVHEDTKRHTPNNFTNAKGFESNVAPVRIKDKWGIINEKGMQLLIPKYAKIESFKDGVANVSITNLLGVVDLNGRVIIEPEYEYVDYVGNGLFRIEQGDQMGYLNMDGDWVWELK
jgi:hypothetical protein